VTDGRLRRPSVLKGKGALIEGLLGAFWGAPRRCGSASVVQRPRGTGPHTKVRNSARARVMEGGGGAVGWFWRGRGGGESVVLRGMVWEWMVLRGMVLRGMVLYKENDGGRMVWIGFAGWLVLGLVKKKKKKMLDGVFLVLVLFSDRGGGGGF
jgi:hypothetical protein